MNKRRTVLGSIRFLGFALRHQIPNNFKIWLDLSRSRPRLYWTEEKWNTFTDLLTPIEVGVQNRTTAWYLAHLYFQRYPEGTVSDFLEYRSTYGPFNNW